MQPEEPPSVTADAAPDAEGSGIEVPALPRTVETFRNGSTELFVVGTAHVSAESVADVLSTLDSVKPDVVCVELCPARAETLRQRDSWRKLNIYRVIKEGKAGLLLSSLMMTSFQRRIAKKLGVEPGAEMKQAMEWADENGAEIALVDRDIQITLRRTWARLGFWQRWKMAFQLLLGLFSSEEIEAEEIEKLKEEGLLGDLMQSLAQAFPSIKSTLIDERDLYLSQKISEAGGRRSVAVVGAGHVPGIRHQLNSGQTVELAALEEVPPPARWPKVVQWAIPALVLGLLVYGFYRGGSTESATSIFLWVGINGALSAIGAAAAFGHPLTVLSAFVAAPLTSLNPMIAAGWVAGLVQAWVLKPTVSDLEDLPEAILTVSGFWKNRVSRVLLVVALANLGSMLGTFVAGGWIAARVL